MRHAVLVLVLLTTTAAHAASDLATTGQPTGLVGHSLGGRAVVIAPTIEKSFTPVVGLAPAVQAAGAQLGADLQQHVAWMMMGGTADTLVSFTTWTQPFFEGLLAPAFL